MGLFGAGAKAVPCTVLCGDHPAVDVISIEMRGDPKLFSRDCPVFNRPIDVNRAHNELTGATRERKEKLIRVAINLPVMNVLQNRGCEWRGPVIVVVPTISGTVIAELALVDLAADRARDDPSSLQGPTQPDPTPNLLHAVA